jgi:hypothetical protein
MVFETIVYPCESELKAFLIIGGLGNVYFTLQTSYLYNTLVEISVWQSMELWEWM